VAFKQTLHWLRQHPALAISGSGPATFSSKMAFKATALDIAGQYPKALAYRSYDFEQNHLALFLSFFTAPEKCIPSCILLIQFTTSSWVNMGLSASRL
jgi:hypothetical protein